MCEEPPSSCRCVAGVRQALNSQNINTNLCTTPMRKLTLTGNE